ncbi:dihydrofolate reductase [Aureimonas sp. SA4125]|uniref:dihydrofolate reductase n=1 Tax=Aureimonas sp. SA4125 TaxID=2826993 RepID=UPI001CC62EAB|nr:dihydrofolate reductase [Aureimonas sp. SA4125]BDA85531.1 dihydrofolate reductase [Aureimonas sp. SA4125]
MTRLVCVVAMAENRVIGRDGAMPWSLSTDLGRYRRLTMGKPMIMGRKTFESIGRALDGRDSIVLTRASALPLPGAHRVSSPQEALALATHFAEARGAAEIVIAGGAEIYALFLPCTDRLYVTHAACEPLGDARFPAIDPADWEVVAAQAVPAGERDSVASRFVTYDRRSTP